MPYLVLSSVFSKVDDALQAKPGMVRQERAYLGDVLH